MSLKKLCSVHQVTVEDASVESTSSASAKRVYSTANRGEKPTSLACRVVPVSSMESAEYKSRGFEVSHTVYVQEQDPQVSTLSRMVFEGRTLYVKSVRNPDELGRFWAVYVEEQVQKSR